MNEKHRRWHVGLRGHEFDLQTLAELLSDGPTSVRKQDEGWFLSSELLEELEDSSQVRTRAAELVEVLNGACIIHGGEYQSVAVTSDIVELDESGDRRKHAVVVADSLKIRTKVSAVVVGPDGVQKEDQTSRIFRESVEKGRSIQDVWDVFHFLNQGQTWMNLYRVFEIIRDDMGRDVYTLVDENALKRFKGTAQSKKLFGDAARHASSKYPGPANPLGLPQAKQLIRELTKKWLERN